MLLNDKVIHSKSKNIKIDNGYIWIHYDYIRKQALNNLKSKKLNKSYKKGKQNNEFREKNKKK